MNICLPHRSLRLETAKIYFIVRGREERRIEKKARRII